MFQCARLSSDPDIMKAAAGSPMLREGSRGQGVRVLQLALIDLGFPMPASTNGGHGLPDGIFGPETLRSVQTFQRANGLAADGVVGPETLGALDRLLAFRSEAAFRTDVARRYAAGGPG